MKRASSVSPHPRSRLATAFHIRKSNISDKNGPCVDDLVIDVTTLGTGTLNILAQLLGKGVSLAWPSEKYSWSKRDNSEFPNMLLLALFYPDATA